MKTASIPDLRISSKLRKAVEDVLVDDETLSDFVVEAIELNIQRRMAQRGFPKSRPASAAGAEESDDSAPPRPRSSEFDARVARLVKVAKQNWNKRQG